MIKNIKEKIIGGAGSISGVASVLGSWQICHNVCLGIIALLSLLGIAVVGMPLLFLTKIAVPLWTIAFIILLITTGIYIKKLCISGKLILFNSGIIIFGIPFQFLQQYLLYFRVIGGAIIILAIIFFIKDKIGGKDRI